MNIVGSSIFRIRSSFAIYGYHDIANRLMASKQGSSWYFFIAHSSNRVPGLLESAHPQDQVNG
jgi:hypothetical protein